MEITESIKVSKEELEMIEFALKFTKKNIEQHSEIKPKLEKLIHDIRLIHQKIQYSNPKTVLKNKLTNREYEVALLLVKGFTTEEISKELYISMNTVKTHIKNIYKKLEIQGKADLLINFYEGSI